MKTVLLVDDLDGSRLALRWFLTQFGYVVDTASSAEEALAIFSPATHDVVLTDNKMKGMTGVEMAHIIKLRSPTTPVVMYSGAPPKDDKCLDWVIQKPANFLQVMAGLDKVTSGNLSS